MLEGPFFLIPRDVPNSRERENQWIYNTFRTMELSNKKHLLEADDVSCKVLAEKEEQKTNLIFLFPTRDEIIQEDDAGAAALDPDSLIRQLSRDMSLNCLARCSRSYYGVIASLNRGFRSVVRSGEIYKLRRQMGIAEYWIYFSCSAFLWEAFDPNRRKWITLPRVPAGDCFMCSDKESLAVGTELLLFGREIMANVVYRYSILTHSWSHGTAMNTPRCLFGSASQGEIGVFAGGCDVYGNIMDVVELYNSVTGTWEILPSLNRARRMSSGVFMDGKFYVIGGVGVEDEKGEQKRLRCGEEYDFKTRKWREIPNMVPPRDDEEKMMSESPPLVAVVNNVLYAADHEKWVVKRYVKDSNSWVTIGRLPARASSVNGWGIGFRACGDRLVVVGGYKGVGSRLFEVNAWVPDGGAPRWNLLSRGLSGSFVYNCAVMGC